MNPHFRFRDMDHEQVRAAGIAELYLAQELTPEESAAFEDHFFDCSACQSDLDLARRFRAGMATEAVRGELQAPAPVIAMPPPAARPSSRRLWLAAAAALAVTAIPAGWVYQDLSGRLTATQRQLFSARRSLLDQQQTQSLEVARLSSPSAETRVIRLEVFRSAAVPETTIPAAGAYTVLEVASPPMAASSKNRVRITNPEGKAIWQQDGVAASREGFLTVTLPPGSLRPGRNLLLVEEVLADGRTAPAGAFPLQVKP